MFKYDNNIVINSKFYFAKSDDIYLDIPLLLDFYTYNMPTLLTIIRADITYKLNVPQHKLNLINKYIDGFCLMFEEHGYENKVKLSNLVNTSYQNKHLISDSLYDFIQMQSALHTYTNFNSNTLMFYPKSSNSKFVFIVIRQEYSVESLNSLNSFSYSEYSDIDVSQFPQILEIEIELYDKNFSKIHKLFDINNVWLTQYDNIVIYGIACDCHSNMNDWVNKVTNECVGSLNEFKSSNINSFNNQLSDPFITNNINFENYQEKFLIQSIKSIKVIFSDTKINTCIEIVEMHYNIQKTMNNAIFNVHP
jgi:hypothetical protein